MSISARARGIVVVGALVVLAACGGSSSGSSTTVLSDPELALGRKVYADRCQACHGSRGTGGIGPALGDGKVAAKYPNVADQIAVVTDGRNTMPAWGKTLRAEEIAAVVRYSREVLGR